MLVVIAGIPLQRDTAGSSCSRKRDIWMEKIIKTNKHMNKLSLRGEGKTALNSFCLPAVKRDTNSSFTVELRLECIAA